MLGPHPTIFLEEVWPADIVHGAPGVEPVVAILALQGRAQVNSLGPVKVRSDILQLGLVAPVLGLRREENLIKGKESCGEASGDT